METDRQEHNCRYLVGKERFAYRVGAIIIEDGHVLLATNDTSKYYYTVGGAVHFGETAKEAVERETREETGIDYEAERLVFTYENIFHDKSGSVLHNFKCHNLELYFLMKPRGARPEIKHRSECIDGDEHTDWLPIDRLGEFDVYPTFFAEKLKNLPTGIEHIVEREDD